MAMSVDRDQDVHAKSMWENQPWSNLINSENLGESSKKILDIKSFSHSEGTNKGEVPMNKKRSRGGVVIRENDIKNGEGKDGKYRDTNHEKHILIERERKNKMRNMFSSIHALLPELPSKADRSTIVDTAVNKIKNLEKILENLEKKKQEKQKNVSLFGCESSLVINKSQWNPYESRKIIIVDPGSSSYNNDLPTSAVANSYPNSNVVSLSAPPPQPVAFQTWCYHNVVLNICGGEAQFCICATKMSGHFTIIILSFKKYMIDVLSANIMCNGNGTFYMIQAYARQCSSDTNSIGETFKQAAQEIMTRIS